MGVFVRVTTHTGVLKKKKYEKSLISGFNLDKEIKQTFLRVRSEPKFRHRIQGVPKHIEYVFFPNTSLEPWTDMFVFFFTAKIATKNCKVPHCR